MHETENIPSETDRYQHHDVCNVTIPATYHNYLSLNVCLQMSTDVPTDALDIQQKNDNINIVIENLTQPETGKAIHTSQDLAR